VGHPCRHTLGIRSRGQWEILDRHRLHRHCGGPANGVDGVVDASEGGNRGRQLLLQTRHRFLQDKNLVLQGCQRSDDLFDGRQTMGQVLEGNCRFFPGSRAIVDDRRPAHGGSATVAN
jgi:hypothetical protein